MKIKRLIILTLFFLVIGFAAIATNLSLKGTSMFGANIDDFDVYFSKANVNGIDLSNSVISYDKKMISFGIYELKNIGDVFVLEYEVVNASTQYDAEISLEIDLNGMENYFEVNNDLGENILFSQSKKNGTLSIKLINLMIDETIVNCEYKLIIRAVERTSVGIEVCGNDNPSIPYLSGGNDQWSKDDIEIILSQYGTSISGVSHYEYLITDNDMIPNNSTSATGIIDGNLIISTNGINFVYYRTVSNSGCKSGWSNGIKVMIDKTLPALNLNSFIPVSVTKGDSYSIVASHSLSNISGGELSCFSSLDGVLKNNDVAELTTLGLHNISCEVKTGSGISVSKSLDVIITYAPYNVVNLITNSSFEDGISEWGNKGGSVSYIHNDSIVKYGNRSFEVVVDKAQSFARALYSDVDGLANHILYSRVSTSRSNTTVSPGIYVISAETNNMWPSLSNSAVKWNSITDPNEWGNISIILNAQYNHLIIMLAQSNTTGVGSVYFDGLMVVDLTATFGEGNEPDLSWCDQHFLYFDEETIIYK